MNEFILKHEHLLRGILTFLVAFTVSGAITRYLCKRVEKEKDESIE